MTKTNFTAQPWLTWVLALPMMFLGIQLTQAQGLACNNLVQVSVDDTPNQCHALINADMILEGDPLPGHDYKITIKKGLQVIAQGVNEVHINGASQYFGTTLTVTIEDLSTGNSCWGNMILEDKLPPVITCTTVNVGCWEDLNNLPLPTAVDNCDATPTVQLTNETINTSGLCSNGTVVITRTYIAFDDYNNISAACNQVINVNRPAAVDFPNDIIWTCDQYAAFPNIVNATALHPFIKDTKPATPNVIDVNLDPGCDDNDGPFSDQPHINSTNTANGGNGCPGNGLDDADVLALTGSGVVANIIGQYCNYQQSSSDQLLQTCGNTFKIIRTWTVLDWCTGLVVTTGVGGEDNVQIIKVVDEVAPSISRAPFEVPITVPAQHPQVCTSTGFLQPPTVSDNCNDVTVKIFTPVGEAIYINGNGANGGMIPAPGLPVGVHDITYQATDACGNQTSITVKVTVKDVSAPTTVCDEITDVNLASDGKAVVLASVFDDGSHDNCCLDHFEVRRMVDNCDDGHDDTVFGPSVVFCCNDVGQAVTVVFRAFDCYGNYNDCMVTVNVNDKIGPVLTSCPQNQRITCDFYADNLETQLAGKSGAEQCDILTQYFGSASFYDNCAANVTCNTSINIDQCLEGTITRTWTAKDPSGNNGNQSCTQTIFVDHVSDWVVEFPADITVTCGNTVPNFGEPEIFYETCELVAVSFSDQVFTVVPDACYKIQRKWTVINWCVVGNNIDQEVVEVPENALGLPFPQCDLDKDGDCDNRTFRDSWNATSKPTAADATKQTGPDTDPDSDPWDGYIVYEQVIKVIDNVDPVFVNGCQIPDVCILSNGCSATVLLPTPEVQDCSPNVTITATSNIPGGASGFGPFANVPPGTYNVTYKAIDNCNNQTACHATVTVKDCKKPTPYCKNGLVIELMNTTPAMVEVWASDFNAGSFDNCPGTLKYSFSTDTTDKSRTYTCDDLGQQPIQMWVTDAAGNQDYCETFIIVQANMGQCGGPLVANLGGAIANEGNNPVEDVTVSLSGQSNGVVKTDANGMYNFANIPLGNDVTVTPAKDDNPLNGVTTFDLVLISKHILGTQPLDSPYKLIAADANNSKSVTTADLVELRKLILQIIPELPSNTSWRFVDKDYVFPNPANPWLEMFPEVINVNNIPTSVLDADFVAVKVGDVNGSAITNLNAGVEERTTGTFLLVAEDREADRGEEVKMTINAADARVLGYQFTLNFDQQALEFVDIVPGVATTENFGLTLLDKGAITTSWNGEAADNSPLFTVVFRAKQPVRLSEVISVNSRFTPAEAYNLDGGLMGVALSFNGTTASNFELYQNVPNPFKGETVIGFNLPDAGMAKLTVTDMAGRTLKVIEQEFAAGYNEVRLNSKDLQAAGVLYYTLESAANTATRKLIVIE